MALTRKQKIDLIESTHAGLADATSLVLAHYKGLTVAEISDLRSKVKAAGATFKVTQNRLTKRALEGTPFSSDRRPIRRPDSDCVFQRSGSGCQSTC